MLEAHVEDVSTMSMRSVAMRQPTSAQDVHILVHMKTWE